MSNWDDTTSVAAPIVAATDNRQGSSAYVIVIAGSNVGEMYRIDNAIVFGRSSSADVTLVDEGISREHCRLRLADNEVIVEDLGSRNGTFCNGEPVESRRLADGDKIQVGRTTILKFSYHDDLEVNFSKQMFDSALRDGLTSAYNKRYFLERLDSELKFSHRHRAPLSLLMLDLDRFKSVNDTHGHVAGDLVLKRFAARIISSIRDEDVFARYGGEEFAVICRAISRADTVTFAQRLRAETQALEIDYDGMRIPMTVSIGVATLPEDPAQGPEDLIRAADKALYLAKNAGRNRVMVNPSIKTSR